MAFPTDTHPAVGSQVTVDGSNRNTSPVLNLVNAMAQLADGGFVGVVAKGRVGSSARGWTYLPGTSTFQSDLSGQVPTVSALRQSATNGGEITFTVVPTATATRIGIDRDGDGYLDGDEIAAVRAQIARVGEPVAVGVALRGVGDRRAVVARVGHAIPVAEDGVGATLIDATLPAGAGWTPSGSTWTFTSAGGVQGITQARVRQSRRTPGDLKVSAKGRGMSWAVSPGAQPIRPLVAIDAPMAATGQCADASFATCAVTGGGRAIRCR